MNELPEEVEIPEQLPVMTLRETVFFPHAIMPLYIFEDRYREMLKNVLQGNCLFGVLQQKESPSSTDQPFEPPHAMGTVGIVRASHKNPDGTTNLVLQGIKRIALKAIVQETPYRIVEVVPHDDVLDVDQSQIEERKKSVNEYIKEYPLFTQGLPEEFVHFLDTISDPAAYLDVTIYATCNDALIKQQLLETLNLSERFNRYLTYLNRELQRQDLYRTLQGRTRDDEIDLN